MRKRVIYLAIAFITFLAMMYIGDFIVKPESLSRVQVLEDGWYVRYNDIEYTDVKLSSLRKLIGNGTYKGDKLLLVHENVDLSSYASPALMMESRFSAWKVSCDHEEVSQRYIDYFENGKFIGCENNFVTLPTSDSPVELEIEFLVSETGAYSFYEPIVAADYMDLLLYAVYNNLFIFLISVFLIIFGIMFFVIAIGFSSSFTEINMQMYSAILFILLGVWFLTQFKVLDLFMDSNGHQTEIEYISLYLLVPIMYLTMGCNRNYLRSKLFLSFSITGSVVAITPIFLHFFNIVHINQMLYVFQLDAWALCTFMVIMLFRDSKSGTLTMPQTIQLAGQTALVVSFFFNAIFYYLEVFGVYEQIMLSKKAVPMGAICMVFATLVNYQIYISESYARQREYNSLTHLAYADGLTDIPNRSRYEKYLADLNKKEDDYIIISIDLNGLKQVNDKQSHLMGDKYLLDFTDALEQTFSRKGFFARIGGDEFVVILTGDYMAQVDDLLKELNSKLEEMNKADPSINRSAAAGYAFRHETSTTDLNSVYLLADERMYINKRNR
ncbi:GGDEF domain-containing protein [Butyrivibrio proteoclasticus]|uniref:GGDEF domain-containing protein n=1 Tax=Butyrivibrio proteoclasticus TaxID=43305 RepID=UPI00047B6231|nr:GGDEF domain-containing protein [Butyrivibrio proteoclasticus]